MPPSKASRNLFYECGAEFCENRVYRYRLYRIWDKTKPNVVWCMLNPSIADEVINDPTVERCQKRAELSEPGRFGGIVVVNIFAYRSTDPFVLPELKDPIGPKNNEAIMKAATENCGLFMCGWGGHGLLYDRGKDVLAMVRAAGVKPHALNMNADGTPQHPLYLAYAKKPFLIP